MSWFESYGDDYFESLFMKDLGRDEAYLRITNDGSVIPVYLLQSHRECVECDYYKRGVIYANEDLKVKSSYKYQISKSSTGGHENVLCDLNEEIGEFGVYNLTFNDTNCSFETLKEPVNIYLPMLTVLLIYMVLILLFILGTKLENRLGRKKQTDSEISNEKGTKQRIRSLDVVRGISITIMIFVNLGAGGYEILDHAPWNGLHLADFVFPLFLWIMGACIPISLVSSFKKQVSNESLVINITIRSIKLFCLGIFLNSGIYLDKFRIMAVLQRFGICYFVVTLICIYFLNRSKLLNPQVLVVSFTNVILALQRNLFFGIETFKIVNKKLADTLTRIHTNAFQEHLRTHKYKGKPETFSKFIETKMSNSIWMKINRDISTNVQYRSTEKQLHFLRSLMTTLYGWIPVICIAVLHLLIVFLVADEGCEMGYFGPGGLHKHGKYQNCTGGATGFLDRAILGPHAYQRPTSVEVYHSQPFDPEGLIGCLNSILHTYVGVQAGVILLVHADHKSRIGHWLGWAVICGVLGGCLCGFSIEDGLIPVNKNLWSLSFVLVTSSVAFALLTLCYILIDMKNLWRGRPFFYAGMNSILMYIGHSVTSGFFPFSWKINDTDTQTHFLFFLENVTATAIWILISYHLYRIKYFFTI